jgi:hypothetical protein
MAADYLMIKIKLFACAATGDISFLKRHIASNKRWWNVIVRAVACSVV